MDRFVRYAPLVVVLSVLLGLGIAFPASATSYVIEPIASLLWAAWRIAASVDQHIYWALLIFLCSLLMIRVFASGHSSMPGSEQTSARNSPSRIERWRDLLEDASHTHDGSAALRDNLGNLVVSIIGQIEPRAPANLEEALSWRQVPVPPAARRYLMTGRRGDECPEDYRLNPLRKVRGWLRRGARKATAADDVAIRQLLEWMESVMEINHDR